MRGNPASGVKPSDRALLLRDIEIVMDAAETALLVAAENDADAALEGQAAVEEGFGGKEGGIGGAFVVAAAPRIDIAILEVGAVGRVRPAVAFGDDIEMAQRGDVFGALAELGVARIPIHVFGAEAELLAKRERIIEGIAARLAEGSVGRGVGFYAGDAQNALQSGDDLVLMAVNPGVEGLNIGSVGVFIRLGLTFYNNDGPL